MIYYIFHIFAQQQLLSVILGPFQMSGNFWNKDWDLIHDRLFTRVFFRLLNVCY